MCIYKLGQRMYMNGDENYLSSKIQILSLQLEFWFGLLFYVPVNSYGHVGTDNSPYLIFSFACLTLTKQLTSCTYFHLQLTTTLLESVEGKRTTVEILLWSISMGQGRIQTLEPWIYSQTHICIQTGYWLHLLASVLELVMPPKGEPFSVNGNNFSF